MDESSAESDHMGMGRCSGIDRNGIVAVVSLASSFGVSSVSACSRSVGFDEGKAGKSSLAEGYCIRHLPGTLGTGSIAGAASALALGGPGSLFWIMISGVLGMGLKYAETTLACAYQRPDGKGGWIGGAMILLGEKKKQVFLSVCFCLCCLFAALGVGCMAPAGAIISGRTRLFAFPFLYGRHRGFAFMAVAFRKRQKDPGN